ncbi:MAG: nucleoside deaminase [Pontixanthobacter sp.]
MRPLFPPQYMDRAFELAREAASYGEVPVGAVIVCDGAIVGEGRNATCGVPSGARPDPSAHAEIVAIRNAAGRLGRERLTDCSLWVTLEPCAMCAGAIIHARVAALYYAAADPKGGAVDHGPRLFTRDGCLHRPDVYSGMRADESGALLRAFFAERR